MSGARIGWYGDDFTGATDTLLNAAEAGLRALLFTRIPTPEQLARAGELDAIGIAGAARSMAPEAMARELEPVGRFFAGLDVPVLHYKVCSTFDSAPRIGNIATAIAALRPHVSSSFVPIVGGQPNIGRYCAFSNLYAAAGAGGAVYRIDRHPTMSRHPVTPMHEADLRAHFDTLGLADVAGLHLPAYEQAAEALDAQLDALTGMGDPAAVLMDIAQPAHLAAAGRLIWRRAQAARLLAVGPSSVVQALAAHWAQSGALRARPSQGAPRPPQTPVFVLAGSLSPVTARQVAAARSYTKLALDAARLGEADYRATCVVQAVQHLRAGRPVLAGTAFEGRADAGADTHAVALACAALLKELLAQMPLARVGIAGGDTSSHAVQALDLWGLSHLRVLGPGAALVRAHSDDAALDGVELMLKGGQMGQEDLFERLLH